MAVWITKTHFFIKREGESGSCFMPLQALCSPRCSPPPHPDCSQLSPRVIAVHCLIHRGFHSFCYLLGPSRHLRLLAQLYPDHIFQHTFRLLYFRYLCLEFPSLPFRPGKLLLRITQPLLPFPSWVLSALSHPNTQTANSTRYLLLTFISSMPGKAPSA